MQKVLLTIYIFCAAVRKGAWCAGWRRAACVLPVYSVLLSLHHAHWNTNIKVPHTPFLGHTHGHAEDSRKNLFTPPHPRIQTLLTALSGCVCSQQNARPQSHAQCDFRIARWPEERRVDRTEQEASASTKRAMAVRPSCLVVTERPPKQSVMRHVQNDD